MKKRILTGDRPTGPLHIGHYVGSLENRVRLQDQYECFFIIADYQYLTDHLKETAEIEGYVYEILLDWLSVGMDPEKSTFFIQSRVPTIAEITMYFGMMVTVPRLQRNPTVKDEAKAAHIREISYGFLGYPVSQAADILIVRANLVPVGDDNLPHIEQTREIARFFNSNFKEVFPVPEPLVGNFPRLPGLDGQKMSKSRGNAIFLSDSADDVKRKVSSAITDPARIRATDPGHPQACNIYQYYQAFRQEESSEIESRCAGGSIGCVACKLHLADLLNKVLDPIRERRASFAAKPDYVKNVVREGTARTNKEGCETLCLVREALKYDYPNLF